MGKKSRKKRKKQRQKRKEAVLQAKIQPQKMEEPVSIEKEVEKEIEKTASKPVSLESQSFWANAWHRYRKDKMSMFGLYLLLFMFLVALLSPVIVGTKPILCKYQGKYYFPFMGYFDETWENSIFITRDRFNGLYPGNLQKQPDFLFEHVQKKKQRSQRSIARTQKKIEKLKKKSPQLEAKVKEILLQLQSQKTLNKNKIFLSLLSKRYKKKAKEYLKEKELKNISQFFNPTPREKRYFNRMIERKRKKEIKLLWLYKELERKEKILASREKEFLFRKEEQKIKEKNWAIYPLFYADPFNKIKVKQIQKLAQEKHLTQNHWATSLKEVEANSSPPWPVPLSTYKSFIGFKQQPELEKTPTAQIAFLTQMLAKFKKTGLFPQKTIDIANEIVVLLKAAKIKPKNVSYDRRIKDIESFVAQLQEIRASAVLSGKLSSKQATLLKETVEIVDYKLKKLKVQAQEQKLQHFFGTDLYGRDVFARIVHGTRIALLIGFVSMGIATLIGIFLGGIAGFFGGWIDNIISRFIDLVMSVPSLILILAMIAIVPKPTIWHIMVVIGLTSWVSIARLTRGEFIKINTLDYVVAGKALGFSNARIMLRHILPNALAPVIVNVTFGIARAILTESGLSFLGFGVQEPTPTWGAILNTGFKGGLSDYWLIGFASLAIFIAIFTYNVVGDGLQEALDPRLK